MDEVDLEGGGLVRVAVHSYIICEEITIIIEKVFSNFRFFFFFFFGGKHLKVFIFFLATD